MYLRLRHTDKVKRSKVKVKAAGGIQVDGSSSSSNFDLYIALS